MRFAAIIVVAACRTARPVQVPWIPTPAEVAAGGILIDANYLDNIPLPPGNGCGLDSGRDCDDSGMEPLWFAPSRVISGRYYVDGIYIESRGPRYPIWR